MNKRGQSEYYTPTFLIRRSPRKASGLPGSWTGIREYPLLKLESSENESVHVSRGLRERRTYSPVYHGQESCHNLSSQHPFQGEVTLLDQSRRIQSRKANLHRGHDSVHVCVVQTQYPIKDTYFVISKRLLTLSMKLEKGPDREQFNLKPRNSGGPCDKLTLVLPFCKYAVRPFRGHNQGVLRWDKQSEL